MIAVSITTRKILDRFKGLDSIDEGRPDNSGGKQIPGALQVLVEPPYTVSQIDKWLEISRDGDVLAKFGPGEWYCSTEGDIPVNWAPLRKRIA